MFLTILLFWLIEFKDVSFSDKFIFISSVIIMLHTTGILFSYGLQSSLIKKNGSAQCISTGYLITILLGFALAIPYGWHELLLFTMISAALKGIGVIIMLIVVSQIRPFNWMNWLLLILSVGIFLLGFIPEIIKPLFTIILGYIFFRVMSVPASMFVYRTKGDVSLGSQIITLSGQAIWIIYGYIFDNSFIYLSYGSFSTLTVITIFFSLIYPKRVYIEKMEGKPKFHIIVCSIFHRQYYGFTAQSTIGNSSLKTLKFEQEVTCFRCNRGFIETCNL